MDRAAGGRTDSAEAFADSSRDASCGRHFRQMRAVRRRQLPCLVRRRAADPCAELHQFQRPEGFLRGLAAQVRVGAQDVEPRNTVRKKRPKVGQFRARPRLDPSFADDRVRGQIAKDLGRNCWQMVGLSYWTAEDGAKLARDLPVAFEMSDENRQIFWDDVAIVRRPKEYSVHVRRCSPDDILEIDDFDDLRRIDPAYVVRHKDA